MMKRKSAASFLILSFVCLFLVGATFSTCEAQWWWFSTSSSSSSGGTTTGCPSGAICRPETPGSYGTSGPYGYSTTSLPGYAAGATVYVPRTASAPFSAIVFMQPLGGTQSMNAAWGPFFATHGIVYVNCSTNTTADTVDSRATQQKNAVNALKAMNTRTGSVLKGKLVTSRIGVMGWSMGGGASWINASQSGTKTAVTLAGHNMTAINFASKGYSIKCPTLIMNGATDLTILGGMGQSLGVYTAIPYGVPKAIYEVALAGHFDWSGPVTALTPNTGKIALAFQKTYLDGDTRWKRYISRPIDALTWMTSGL